jgi:hypothetical protein
MLQNRRTKLELVDKDVWRKMAAGARGPVLYQLDFPLQSPLPTIKSITVNQEVICRGQRPSKYLFVANPLLNITVTHRAADIQLISNRSFPLTILNQHFKQRFSFPKSATYHSHLIHLDHPDNIR